MEPSSKRWSEHIVEGLSNRHRVGFFWTTEATEDPRPNAWCSSCESRVRATGGEWVGVALEHLQPKILCVACYDFAKDFHLHGKTES
jgi:hypothetical protein